MPTILDPIRLCRCFEADRADLAHYLPQASVIASNRGFATEAEHFLPLRSEAECLQRWLDLNA